jgi:hypothetical protein
MATLLPRTVFFHMSLVRRHIGDWITVQAAAQRHPLGVTLSVTLGELPQGWGDPARARSRPLWRGIAGVVLIAPFVLLIAATLAGQLVGATQPYEWFAGSPIAILAAAMSLFVGLPVAFALNAWTITRLGVRRHRGRLEGLIALEVAPLQRAVVVVALAMAVLFVGHLAADSYACMNGVRSAC